MLLRKVSFFWSHRLNTDTHWRHGVHLGFGKNTLTRIESLSSGGKISFMQLHHFLRKFLESWKLPLTRQSYISMFGNTLVSCLCRVNNTSIFSSFTPILLTVFSNSASRGRLAPLWEQRSSQPLGSWPTSESMFDKGRVSP